MKRAYVGIREQPVYRRDAFVSGLRAVGYDVRVGSPQAWEQHAVYCCWNRYGEQHEICNRVERAGGICLIAENAYCGPAGISPHAMSPREWYALAIGGHNGSGRWNVGGRDRWDALGVDLKPWRTDGEHILVCPNRSFGRPDLIMPVGWAEDVKARLQRVTKRPVRVRPHPGNGKPATPLEDDLRGAWACVIWSSSAGVQALIRGIPVLCEAPYWICSRATSWESDLFEGYRGAVPDVALHPWGVRRLDALGRLAWAQFSVEELSSGWPFSALIDHANNQLRGSQRRRA